MAKTSRPYEPDQMLLMPLSLGDWVPEADRPDATPYDAEPELDDGARPPGSDRDELDQTSRARIRALA